MGDRFQISAGSYRPTYRLDMNTTPILFFGLLLLACITVGTKNGDSQSLAEESFSVRKARYAEARNLPMKKKRNKSSKNKGKKEKKAKGRQMKAKKGKKAKGRQMKAKKGK